MARSRESLLRPIAAGQGLDFRASRCDILITRLTRRSYFGRRTVWDPISQVSTAPPWVGTALSQGLLTQTSTGRGDVRQNYARKGAVPHPTARLPRGYGVAGIQVRGSPGRRQLLWGRPGSFELTIESDLRRAMASAGKMPNEIAAMLATAAVSGALVLRLPRQ
jgi:hypothetical protein